MEISVEIQWINGWYSIVVLIAFPKKGHVKILWMWSYLEIGSWRCNQVKIWGHTRLDWTINQIVIFIRKERSGDTEIHRKGRDQCEGRTRFLSEYSYKPRNANDCQQPPEVTKRQERILL